MVIYHALSDPTITRLLKGENKVRYQAIGGLYSVSVFFILKS